MAVDLTRYVDRIERRAESTAVTRAAAEAMAERVTDAVRVALGGDLTMSGLRGGGAARIEPETRAHAAVVTASGAAFTLIDKGRRRRTTARARRGSALATPWGPRKSARGSTTRAQHVIDDVARSAFAAGCDAAAAEAFGGR